ncbi:MAG TPA: SprT family zinc-dependent metalloprotease [Burkholderiaceae bacterium]|nr:SprT family zinc-dependent metalloprotease [Burkholderiaceae bacterium]
MPRRIELANPLQLGLFDAVAQTGAEVGLAAPPVPDAAPVSTAPAAQEPLPRPHAQREVLLGSQRVGYALRRSRRRSIGFAVGAEGLSVAAPRWVGLADIEAALREKSAWILRKLAEQRERERRLQAARIDWRDGATLPFLGAKLVVVLDPRCGAQPGGVLLDAAAQPGAPALRVGLAHDATPQQIRDAVQSWLQRQARRIFEERCRHFAALLGVQWRRLALSSAQTRWGSASADGSVRLNWRLVHFSMPTIDYVVAHELAHLRHMDHSPRFWDVVRSVVPDLDRARSALRSEVLPVFE